MGLLSKGFEDKSTYKREKGGREYCLIPLKDREGGYLKVYTNTGLLKPIGTLSKAPPRRHSIERFVWGQQSTNSEKVMMIQELRLENGVKELRFCYYIVSSEENAKRKGVWTFGEKGPMMPVSDTEELLAYAAKMGMLSLKGSP